MFNRILGLAGRYRRPLVLCATLALAVLITVHHIGSVPPALSPAESASKIQSTNIHYIADHPLNAPHKLVSYGLQKISARRNGILRLSSYLFALAFTACFYYLVRSWFGRTVGLLGIMVFCLSPFFLIPARVASPEIMFFWPAALMASYHWLNKTDRKNWAWFVLILAAGMAIYTPGLIWLLVGGAVICRKKLLAVISQLDRPIVAAGLILLLVVLLPAGRAIFSDWHLLKDLAAFPGTWPGPVRLAENLGWMILSLFIKTPYHDTLMIGRLPVLDLVQLGLMVFGIYAMSTAALRKAAAIGASFILAVILGAINNDVSFLFLCLPALGIFMAAGLRYLYIEWRGVFPRNPIPKSLALVLMSVLVAIQLVYGLSYSLVAWPHTPDTKATYVLK